MNYAHRNRGTRAHIHAYSIVNVSQDQVAETGRKRINKNKKIKNVSGRKGKVAGVDTAPNQLNLTYMYILIASQ